MILPFMHLRSSIPPSLISVYKLTSINVGLPMLRPRFSPVLGPVAEDAPPKLALPTPTECPMLIIPPSVEDGAKANYGLKFCDVWVDPPAIC